jgi:phosphoribosyl 1,2-cyclic phosphodiesterase
MVVKPLASGSTGNAYIITDGGSSLLLDAGIPLERIQEGCGYTASSLAGCLVTHEHGDHIKAAKGLARLGVDIYASRGTLDAAGLSGHRFHAVEALRPFTAGAFTVTPFDVEHDTAEPLGFVIQGGGTADRLMYVTDTCYVKYRVEGLTHVMIEANFDMDELERNVMGGRVDAARAARTVRSHMSIEACMRTLEGLDRSRLRRVYLLHLSGDNSRAEDFKGRVMALTGAEVYVC